MQTNNKKGINRIIYRFVRWLRKCFDFLAPSRIDIDLGKK